VTWGWRRAAHVDRGLPLIVEDVDQFGLVYVDRDLTFVVGIRREVAGGVAARRSATAGDCSRR
jgi:hypothetical protein